VSAGGLASFWFATSLQFSITSSITLIPTTRPLPPPIRSCWRFFLTSSAQFQPLPLSSTPPRTRGPTLPVSVTDCASVVPHSPSTTFAVHEELDFRCGICLVCLAAALSTMKAASAWPVSLHPIWRYRRQHAAVIQDRDPQPILRGHAATLWTLSFDGAATGTKGFVLVGTISWINVHHVRLPQPAHSKRSGQDSLSLVDVQHACGKNGLFNPVSSCNFLCDVLTVAAVHAHEDSDSAERAQLAPSWQLVYERSQNAAPALRDRFLHRLAKLVAATATTPENDDQV
jgi:hypothetical protein